MTRAKERTQKLNELIVGIVRLPFNMLCSLICILDWFCFPPPETRFPSAWNTIIYCGWASDEHWGVGLDCSSSVKIFINFTVSPTEIPFIGDALSIIKSLLIHSAHSLISSKWQQLHGNWMNRPPEGNHPPQDKTSTNGKQTRHEDRLRLWFVVRRFLIPRNLIFHFE